MVICSFIPRRPHEILPRLPAVEGGRYGHAAQARLRIHPPPSGPRPRLQVAPG
jgi:hypothetical protein